ncbi:DUF4292 domain-containing protein [Aquimarina brevivitae]|uniref:Uncharacterized protein DUF4292 n=1 Tax=Aquimarina brevivitae TaxID=323412 RepID=A0A4Q7PGH8_9FLAO|nr:DUF4292 domain-containing protein [Aquimarina brevivitae]RZS99247.1 uncharacterized protein DUF4292 [Aquimarina brevivitae]
MTKKLIVILLLFVTVLSGCKSSNVDKAGAIDAMNSDKIISNHYNRSFNFNTINARLKVTYDDGKKSVSPTVSLRMKKDEVIWISAKVLGITVAKAMLTPDKVTYYEKINNTYFDGSFKMIEEWLGTDLDFYKVQQMLLGQSMFDLRGEKFKASVQNENYKLQPKKELAHFDRLLLVQPASFKMALQGISQPKENRTLQIKYPTYQKVGNQYFPKEIYIKADQAEERTLITIEYRVVDFNPEISFPYNIPSGYEELTIK